jgi:hypothetical protein
MMKFLYQMLGNQSLANDIEKTVLVGNQKGIIMKDMSVEHLIGEIVYGAVLSQEAPKYVDELLRRFKDMKCCGNCKLKHHKTKCPSYDYDFTTPVTSGGYCDHYKADGLTREERKVK